MTISTNVKKILIGTCAPNFAGAGKIMTQVLRELMKEGVEASYVGLARPHLYESTLGLEPEIIICPEVQSDAITEKGTLNIFQLAENIVNIARSKHFDRTTITIWGTYLFPYAHAALLAKQTLQSQGVSARLVVSPAGSDIWQLGPQLTRTAKYVLFDPHVNARLTYTKQFADEISRMFDDESPTETIYPILDTQRFREITSEKKLALRKVMGICPEDFVICSHSNMRPVKRPELVMEIARRVALQLKVRRLLLLLVGPLSESLSERATMMSFNSANFEIRSVGLVANVEDFLGVSDVALNWSAHDSFCGSLMEAMGCGLPIASTNVVGIGCEVLAGSGGMLFRDGDLSGAATYISSLGHDESLRAKVGSNAAMHADSTFSGETLISNYMGVLFPSVHS